MNSCLYECSVMHHRFTPKEHHFEHAIFMFYLDLDELDQAARNVFLFSHNRRNLYSFCDADHEPAGPAPLKQRVLAYLRQEGVPCRPDTKVMLLTLPRMAGYIFNPISIYYCFAGDGKPFAAVAEVGNTFREIKLYLLRPDTLGTNGTFSLVVPKHFYVSPFSSLQLNFDFRLATPGAKLDIRIDDHDDIKPVLISTLTGRRAELTNRNLAWFTLKYPFITLKVIGLIHWHALKLWLKKIPFYRKTENLALQQDVLRPHPSLTAKIK